MNKKLKAGTSKKRGRPVSKKEKGDAILSSGLLQRQWERIQSESPAGKATERLRFIVDWYYKQVDAEREIVVANEGLISAEEEERELNPTQLEQLRAG